MLFLHLSLWDPNRTGLFSKSVWWVSISCLLSSNLTLVNIHSESLRRGQVHKRVACLFDWGIRFYTCHHGQPYMSVISVHFRGPCVQEIMQPICPSSHHWRTLCSSCQRRNYVLQSTRASSLQIFQPVNFKLSPNPGKTPLNWFLKLVWWKMRWGIV